MSEAKVVVAVSNVCANDLIVASAIVYPVTAQGPVFTYTGDGNVINKVSVHDYQTLSTQHREMIARYFRDSYLATATVKTKNKEIDRVDFMGLAVARSLEALHHRRADVVSTLFKDNVRILVPGTKHLPERYTGKAPQLLVADKAKADWRIQGAHVVARFQSTFRH